MNESGAALPVDFVKPHVLRTLGWWLEFERVWYTNDGKETARETEQEIARMQALLALCEHSATGTIDITLSLLNYIMQKREDPGKNKDTF